MASLSCKIFLVVNNAKSNVVHEVNLVTIILAGGWGGGDVVPLDVLLLSSILG